MTSKTKPSKKKVIDLTEKQKLEDAYKCLVECREARDKAALNLKNAATALNAARDYFEVITDEIKYNKTDDGYYADLDDM